MAYILASATSGIGFVFTCFRFLVACGLGEGVWVPRTAAGTSARSACDPLLICFLSFAIDEGSVSCDACTFVVLLLQAVDSVRKIGVDLEKVKSIPQSQTLMSLVRFYTKHFVFLLIWSRRTTMLQLYPEHCIFARKCNVRGRVVTFFRFDQTNRKTMFQLYPKLCVFFIRANQLHQSLGVGYRFNFLRPGQLR